MQKVSDVEKYCNILMKVNIHYQNYSIESLLFGLD
jgi:hypothetical protein